MTATRNTSTETDRTDAGGMIRVLGLSGSLRRGSFNTGALRTARDLAPPGMTIDIHPLNAIPMYDFDLEQQGTPDAVAELRAAIAGADGVLIACPEYNYSVTGALKNALDWASRPPDSPLNGTPVAMFGVGGRFGTVRAQMHLREIALHNRMRVVDTVQVYIPRNEAEFDADREIVSDRHREQIRRLLDGLAEIIDVDRLHATKGG